MLQLANLTRIERRTLCEELAELMARETVVCSSREQQEWLVAKAWSSASGRTKKKTRHSGPRQKIDWADIRVIFEDLGAVLPQKNPTR